MWIFTSFYSKFVEIIILKKASILIELHVVSKNIEAT